MTERIGFYLCIDQHPLYSTKGAPGNGLQLSTTEDSGCGYRISGPKYDGSSVRLVRHAITHRDIEELRRFLSRASRWLKKQEA